MNAMSDIALEYEMRKRARYHVAGGAGLGVLTVLVLLGLMHEQIAPYAVGAGGTGAPLSEPGAAHPFGTDILGRDIWSETIHALRFTLDAAIPAFVFALVAGPFAGRMTASLLGPFGQALKIGINVLASIPSVLMAILFVAIIGTENFALAAGIALVPAGFSAGFDRAQAHRNASYVEYARASGVTDGALLRRDLKHWIRASLIAECARLLSAAIILVSTVSFFGFGAQPPARDLGLVIASARNDLGQAWWGALGPAIVLIVLVMAVRAAGGLTGGDKE